ncbi:LOW QUALITY PROTEIN: uncharacterized protein ACNLHF_011402 [Anomaloglossus baeobatrachus]
MAERVSMNFTTLKHISENSTFIPVIPNTYKSTEMLWSALLDQTYAYDKSCISRCVFKKKKRLVMLAKLVSTFEESISKSEHLETLASTRKAEEVTFHCQCCVENMKQIHTLETELRDRVECSAERGKQICMLESRISEKETYYSNMDKKLLQLYTEINQFKNRVASTDALVSTLREDLAAKTQIIADLQQVISNLSRPDMNSMSTIPTKQVCVSGTTQEETAATVSTPPRDHRSGDSETRGQVERSLQFTPIPVEVRCSSRFRGEDYSWRCESRWDANPTTSNLPNCSERQEEFYPNHKSMERINFLLRICKEIPKYDPNVDPFTSCDIFEGHCNKYSVAPEYSMELFKLWLPTHLNQRYEATWKAHPRNGQYHSEEERLSLLMTLTTGHQDVTPDILTKFKPTINDEPLSLCSRFEAMYRKIDQGIGIPQGMIRMFVEKFPYLDTAIRLSAAREPSLTDAAMIIEQCRQDLLHNKKSINIRQHVPVYVKSQDERAHHAKSSRVLPYIGQIGGIHGPINVCKSKVVKSTSLLMKEFKTSKENKPGPKYNMACILNKCSFDLMTLTLDYLNQAIITKREEIVVIEQQLNSTSSAEDLAKIKDQLQMDLLRFYRNLRIKAHFSSLSDIGLRPSTQSTSIAPINIQGLGLKTKSTFMPPKNNPPVETFIGLLEHDITSFFKDVSNKSLHCPSNFSDKDKNALASLMQDKDIIIKQADKALPDQSGFSRESDVHNLITQSNNLTKSEMKALCTLEKDTTIIIKPSDKGSNMVVMDSHEYRKICLEILRDNATYKKIFGNPLESSRNFLKNLLSKAKVYGLVSNEEFSFLVPDFPVMSTFYILPKVHKGVSPLRGRPIVLGVGSIGQNVGIYLDEILNPFVTSLSSYIRDSMDFIKRIKGVTVDSGTFLASIDVETLYSSIPHDQGMRAIEYFLSTRGQQFETHKQLILSLLHFVLHNNFLMFDGSVL